jgi:two-component system, NtrC family, sensor histidine kinase KinB
MPLPPKLLVYRPERAPSRYLLAALFVTLAASAATLLERLLPLPDPAMVLLTGVLVTAVFCGLGPSLFASVASFLVFDVLFVDPLYQLTVSKPQDVVSLCVFLIVATLTSQLTARVREQARAVALERARTDLVLEEKAKTEQIMEAIEDGIIVLGMDGSVVHVNEVASAILGVERAEALGRPFDDLDATHSHHLRLRSAVREVLAEPRRDHERVEITVFLRGRDHHYVLRETAFLTRTGAVRGSILVLQDVTYLRDQEAWREDVVSMLSHELRTPLTSLGMAVELLAGRSLSLDSTGRDLVETAREDVGRLRDVAQRFLDLARARATSIALDRRNVDVSDVAGRVRRLFTLQAREKGVVVDVTNPGAGMIVVGDETKLTWAVSNLVANAIRYTPRGGRVGIACEARNGAVAVSVTDTGPGIPMDEQGRIFDRFVQSSHSGETGSAGLGLSIVRDIVQAHGGHIHLESELGTGTRFTVELPKG